MWNLSRGGALAIAAVLPGCETTTPPATDASASAREAATPPDSMTGGEVGAADDASAAEATQVDTVSDVGNDEVDATGPAAADAAYPSLPTYKNGLACGGDASQSVPECSPPPSVCANSSTLVYYINGQCVSGTCSWQEASQLCTCSGGACMTFRTN